MTLQNLDFSLLPITNTFYRNDVGLYFISDADIGQAVALLTALEENEVEVVQGVEGNLTESRDLGQKAEQEGMSYWFIAIPKFDDLKQLSFIFMISTILTDLSWQFFCLSHLEPLMQLSSSDGLIGTGWSATVHLAFGSGSWLG